MVFRYLDRFQDEGVKLLVFPECALIGYPLRDIENSSVVNIQELNFAYKQLQSLVEKMQYI